MCNFFALSPRKLAWSVLCVHTEFRLFHHRIGAVRDCGKQIKRPKIQSLTVQFSGAVNPRVPGNAIHLNAATAAVSKRRWMEKLHCSHLTVKRRWMTHLHLVLRHPATAAVSKRRWMVELHCSHLHVELRHPATAAFSAG